MTVKITGMIESTMPCITRLVKIEGGALLDDLPIRIIKKNRSGEIDNPSLRIIVCVRRTEPPSDRLYNCAQGAPFSQVPPLILFNGMVVVVVVTWGFLFVLVFVFGCTSAYPLLTAPEEPWKLYL